MPRRGYRKPVDETFSERLEVRFTPAQFQRLKADADDCGLTLAAYVRATLGGKAPPRRPTRIAQDAVRQLAAIGNNLNQLAHRANAGRFPMEAELRRVLAEVIRALTRLADDR